MRLRQIAYAASDLASTEAALLDVLGLKTAFRDPGVGHFGLHNAVIPVGGNFLEIVAPTQEKTAAGRYIERRGGDCGYMVLFHTDDAHVTRANAEKLGIRIVWEGSREHIVANHFHPVDMGGVIVSVDSFDRPGDPDEEYSFWEWAGPDWKDDVDTSVTRRMTGVELAHPDPARQAADWSAVLGTPVIATDDDGFDMPMSDGSIVRFRKTAAGEQSGIRALDFEMTDKAEALRRADARGLPCDADGFTLMQVRCNLS